MTYLGHRSATGFLDPDNIIAAGNYTVKFTSADLPPDDFEVFHIAITGPGGNFRVYLDTVFYSNTDRGDINEYDPKWAMYVRRGQTIFFYWSLAAGTVPTVSIFCKTPGML